MNIIQERNHARRVRLLALTCGIVLAGCGADSSPDAIEHAQEEQAPRAMPATGGVQLVSVNTAIQAGRPLIPLSLRRHQRDAEAVALRASVLATRVAGETIPADDLLEWAQESVREQYKATHGAPIPSRPKLAFSYWPHLDYVTVTNGVAAEHRGELFSERESSQLAEDTLRALGESEIIEGDYVLARSGTVATSFENSLPFVNDYVYNFFRVHDGVVINDAWVEVYVNADQRVSKLAIRDVEISEQHPPRVADFSTAEVEADLQARVRAQVSAISPRLTTRFLGPPVPAYHLAASEEGSWSVPELTMRWSTDDGDSAAKANVTTLSYEANAADHHRYPVQEPSFCAEFAPGERIARNEKEVVIDEDYALSFADMRLPFNRCQEGRIHLHKASNTYRVRGVTEDGLLGRIGLDNGDKDLVLCNADSDSSSFRQCEALTDYEASSEAFAMMFDARVFELSFDRAGVRRQLQLSIMDCPEEEGITHCQSLL